MTTPILPGEPFVRVWSPTPGSTSMSTMPSQNKYWQLPAGWAWMITVSGVEGRTVRLYRSPSRLFSTRVLIGERLATQKSPLMVYGASVEFGETAYLSLVVEPLTQADVDARLRATMDLIPRPIQS